MKIQLILGMAAALSLSLASVSSAATLYFSTSGTAGSVGVPNVTFDGATPGQTLTGSLFAWIEINPATEGINGISLNGKAVQVSGTGSISATGVTQDNKNSDNSTRWDFVTAPTINTSGNLFTRSSQAAIGSGSGINDSTFSVGNGGPSIADSGTGEYKLFELDYSIVAPTTGSAVYDIDFTLGQSKFGFASGGPTIGVGSSTDTLTVSGASAVVGSASALPDAVITVNTVSTPEPASIGALGLGAVALLARRRKA